jgi:hypothetical protein
MLRLKSLILSLTVVTLVFFTWDCYTSADTRAYDYLTKQGRNEVRISNVGVSPKCFPYSRADAFDFESSAGSGTVCCFRISCWIP